MSLARALATLAAAALASILISLAVGEARDGPAPDEQPASELGVEWAYRPANLADLIAQSDAVVVGTVERVREGPGLALGPASDPDPTVVPTQLVDVRVEDEVIGDVAGLITVYKLGGGDGAGEMHPDGDPGYEPGERYVLFLERRDNDAKAEPNPGGTYLLTAPDGRLRELDSGRLEATISGPVADRLEGDTLAAAESELADVGPESR